MSIANRNCRLAPLLARVQHLPIELAAAEVGTCVTTFKKASAAAGKLPCMPGCSATLDDPRCCAALARYASPSWKPAVPNASPLYITYRMLAAASLADLPQAWHHAVALPQQHGQGPSTRPWQSGPATGRGSACPAAAAAAGFFASVRGRRQPSTTAAGGWARQQRCHNQWLLSSKRAAEWTAGVAAAAWHACSSSSSRAGSATSPHSHGQQQPDAAPL